jgi:hypothetical protein
MEKLNKKKYLIISICGDRKFRIWRKDGKLRKANGWMR